MWKFVVGSTCFLPQVQALRLGASIPDRVEEQTMLHVNVAVHNHMESFLHEPDNVRKPKLEVLLKNVWFNPGPCQVVSVTGDPIDGFPLTDYDVSFTCAEITSQEYVNRAMWIRNEGMISQDKWAAGILRIGGDKASLMVALSSFTDLSMAMLFISGNDPKFNEGNNRIKLMAMLAGMFPETGSARNMFGIKSVVAEFSPDRSVMQYIVVFNDLTGTLTPIKVYNKFWYNSDGHYDGKKASKAGGFTVWKIKTQAFDINNFQNGIENNGNSNFFGF